MAACQSSWAPPDGIALALSPGVPVNGVLGRLVSLLAARADFSIDRLSDAQRADQRLGRDELFGAGQ